MKNTSKILVVLLALALFTACFSVFAFAEDQDTTVDTDVGTEGDVTTEPEQKPSLEEVLANSLKVLEYYEAPVYLNCDFNGDEVFDEALAKNSSSEITFIKGAAFSSTANGDGTVTVKGLTNKIILHIISHSLIHMNSTDLTGLHRSTSLQFFSIADT